MKNRILFSVFLLVSLVMAFSIHFFSKSQTHTVASKDSSEEEGSKAATIAGRFEQEFLMTRDPKTNTVPRERLFEAYQYAQSLRLQKAGDAFPLYWEERGPNNVGGRTRAILVDANDPSGRTVWAGGVSGGLWRTNNIDASPVTWTKINDFFDNLAVTTIAQDPSNPNVMYFGTGEGWGNFDAVRGLGIWRSLDGGNNWNVLPFTNNAPDFRNIQKIVIDNNRRIFACTNTGVFRSLDNGNTWNDLGFPNRRADDIEIAADGDLFVGINSDQVYQSTDNGNTWTALTSGLPSSGYGRIEIATAPSDDNFIYVIYQDAIRTNSDGTMNTNRNGCLNMGVYQSTTGGNNFTLQTCPTNFGNQAWYDLILGVDPNNENRVWVGGVGASVSNDGGATWNNFDGGHVDYHNFLFVNGSSSEVLIGNDGGVYKSHNGNATAPSVVDKNNGYNVTQFYAAALGNNNDLIGGTQDNGTQGFISSGLNNTTSLIGADGGWCHIDSDQDNIRVGSTQWGNFLVAGSTNNFSSIVAPASMKRRFISPSDYDSDNNILYFSDSLGHVGRITDVGNTNVVTSDSIIALDGELISALEVSPNQMNRVYLGTGNGVIVRLDNAHLPLMTDVTVLSAPLNRYISSIKVEEDNENHLLITYSNYGIVSIWETIDGGATWENVEGNLPDMPVRWIELNPDNGDQAIIATELGVWSTTDLNGVDTRWYPTSSQFGLANVRVDMLQFRASDNLMAAATHGRGIFTTDYFSLFGNCPPDQVLTGAIFSDMYVAENDIESDGTVATNEEVIFRAGDDILLTDGFTVEGDADFWGIIMPCSNGSSRPLVPIITRNNLSSDRQQIKTVRSFPNPARSFTKVEYTLSEATKLDISLNNIEGKLMAQLVNETQIKGNHIINVDLTHYPAGLYFITLSTGNEKITTKLIVSK